MARSIVVNGVKHELPKLGFKAITRLGDMGFDMLSMSLELVLGNTSKINNMLEAAVVHACNCSIADADDMLEEHFENGYGYKEIVEPFEDQLMESEYFLTMLRQAEEKAQPEKKEQTTPKKKTTKASTT